MYGATKRAGYAVKETHFVPHKWRKVGKAAEDFTIHLNIGLKQSSFDELKRLFIEDLDFNAAKDWISVTLSVSAHEDGDQLVRTPEWSLLAHLHEHINSIQPTTSFMRTTGQKTNSVTPECFTNLYSTKGYMLKVPDLIKSASTISSARSQFVLMRTRFPKKYHPGAEDTAYKFPQISITDGPTQNGPLTYTQSLEGTSREANLDVQAIAGIINPTPIISYSTGGSPPFIPDISTTENTNEPYLVWLNYVLGQPIVPQVISTSYADDEQTVPKAYAERVCKQFAQLGINNTCISNDGKNTSMFVPLFPSDSVAFRPGYFGADGSYQIYSSGGGISNYFSTPDHQKKIRAYPGLSAQGQYFAYVWNRTEGVISGTSASTPLMSGILALVSDDLYAHGKPTLGFLNLWFESAAGCGEDGFDATEGWDPVTGFGALIFPLLTELAKRW
ncbi:subtilisin-like protein [Acephala macrosclerotiorum]|nr:subtilisin-like protein [Acephala macrosclerotiorum]